MYVYIDIQTDLSVPVAILLPDLSAGSCPCRCGCPPPQGADRLSSPAAARRRPSPTGTVTAVALRHPSPARRPSLPPVALRCPPPFAARRCRPPPPAVARCRCQPWSVAGVMSRSSRKTGRPLCAVLAGHLSQDRITHYRHRRAPVPICQRKVKAGLVPLTTPACKCR